MTTERQTQEHLAHASDDETVYRWHFVTEPVGAFNSFSAIARTESGAFRVLNAEYPGLVARFNGRTLVPCRRDQTREVAKVWLKRRRG